jgi:TPR repeat protein
MMKREHHSIASIVRIAAVITVIHGGTAQAGPVEDYTAGAKHYAAGDLIAAMPLLRRAADAGHAAAQAAIAEIVDQADSKEEAFGYFSKSAAQGNADGQFGLGVMLASGEGAPKNIAEGRKWITLAAEQGHKTAINELAAAYITGALDIPEKERQSAEALRWVRTAADNGYLTAMERLAAAYRGGEMGLSVDVKAADQWAEKIRKIRGTPKGRRNK